MAVGFGINQMLKRFFETEAWERLKAVIDILLVATLIILLSLAVKSLGIAEEAGYYNIAYIICMPDDYVNVRQWPSTKGEPLGGLDSGHMIYLDGEEKNGFLHIINLNMEEKEGWVYKGYVVYDEPIRIDSDYRVVGPGRLAARKFVDGKRTKWLKPHTLVKVYYITNEWAVTNYGYLKSKFIKPDGE